MNRKRQRRKQLQRNPSGRCKKRNALAWMLCVALAFGNVWVPETGIFVQAAEPAISVEEYSSEEHSSEEQSSWDAADVSEGDSVSGNAVMLFSGAEDNNTGGDGEKEAAKQRVIYACVCGYCNEKAAWTAHARQHLAQREACNYSTFVDHNDFTDDKPQDITWTIDVDGKLTVEGTGEFSISKYGGRAPWYNERQNIKSAVVHVTGLRDASYMFDGCSELTSVDLSEFDVSSVTNMGWMFHGCSSLTSLDLGGFDTSSVTSMQGMFYGCSSLTSLNISSFDTGSVTSTGYMFSGCSSLKSLDVSGFNTSGIKGMVAMFSGCSSLTSLDVSGFDTSSVTSMDYMFLGCSGLESLDVSGFDTSSVTYMVGMFYGCSGLKSLDLSRFDTSSVKGMYVMFSGCKGLESLDLSVFDISSVIDYMADIFSGCSSLTMLCTPYNIPENSSISLPVVENDVWYDSDGTTHTALPTGLDHSIVLAKNTTPEAMPGRLIVRLSKSFYEPGSVVRPEDLTVKYRGADGKTAVLSCKSEDAVSGYTMGAVDTSTPGSKILTISYNDGTDILTQSVTFMVSDSLTDGMVTLPEGEYVYNGKEKKPVPVVKSAVDGTVLTLGRDYTVSYADNIEAGEAVLSVTGRNAYSGTVNKIFTIRKAQPENVEVTFSEAFSEAWENRTRNLSACFDKTAPNNGGIVGYTLGEVTEHSLVADGEGSVLSGTPSINGEGILTYSTNAGTVDDTVLISVIVTFAKNYEDALILVTVCLKDMTPVSISGITVKNTVYSGSPVLPEGTAVVRAEGEAGMDVTALVTLSYQYIGTQADGTAYNSDAAPVHAGSYILTVAVMESDSYAGSAEYSFTIGKAPIIVTAQDVELETGAFDALPDESALACDITGLCGMHTAQDVLSTQPVVSYGLNGEKIDKASIAIDKAGSYELIPYGGELNQTTGSDYEIQSYQNGTLIITESGAGNPDNPDNPDTPTGPPFPDDGVFRISAVPAQTYTGSAIKPIVIVYYGSCRLTEKTDYTVAYKNNTKANDATAEKTAPTITVTGKGNYSGRQTVTFVIKPKNITEEDVSAAELIAAQSNKVQKPVPALTWKGKKLRNKTDFTVSYPDENKSGAYQTAGSYTVAVTGTGNYTGTKNLTFTITNKTLLTKAKVTAKSKDYTGSAVTLSAEDITVKIGKDTLTYGADYTLSYRNNTQAGKATVIVTGTGDSYAGSREVAFQIKGESLAKAQITGVVDKTYTGTAQTQDIQVQLSGRTLQVGTDYTVSYAKEVNAGTASVIVTGKGGYTGTVKKSFKIMAYDLQADEAGKLQGVPKNLTTAYVKGGAAPAPTLTFNGRTLEAKKDYTITYKNNKKPATAADANAPVMLVKGKGNFKGTLSIPFTITVSNLETDNHVTMTAADTAYVNKPGKYAVKPVLTDANGKKLTAGTDYEKTFTYALVNADGTETVLTAADIVSEGGVVKVTATGKGSYTGTLSTTYRITKASFSKAKITVTPQIYTGAPVTLNGKDVTVKIGSDTLTYGEDYTIVPDSYQNNTKKGTATVTIKGLNDYGGARTVKFRITAKPLAALLKFQRD